MNELITSCQWHEVVGIGLLYFSFLYVVAGGFNLLLSRVLLPAVSYGKILDARPVAAGQLRREFTLSAISIVIFGTGLLLPWGLLKMGWVRLATGANPLQVLIEIAVLVVWNEVHFYLIHRLLHTPWLNHFHLQHHRSIVTTPWSTYSFHPVEAMLLGNVILPPMFVHDFSFFALAAVPVFSIVFNNIGHSNYDFLPDAHHDRWWLNGARRHHLHHACYHGNFGFMFPFMDRVFKTDLPPDAAERKLPDTLRNNSP